MDGTYLKEIEGLKLQVATLQTNYIA